MRVLSVLLIRDKYLNKYLRERHQDLFYMKNYLLPSFQDIPHISTEHFFFLSSTGQNAELSQTLCHLEYQTASLTENSQSQVMRERKYKGNRWNLHQRTL